MYVYSVALRRTVPLQLSMPRHVAYTFFSDSNQYQKVTRNAFPLATNNESQQKQKFITLKYASISTSIRKDTIEVPIFEKKAKYGQSKYPHGGVNASKTNTVESREDELFAESSDVSVSEGHEKSSIESRIQSMLEEILKDVAISTDWSRLNDRFKEGSYLESMWPSFLLSYIAHRDRRVEGLFEIGMSLSEYVAGLSERHRVTRLVSTIAICVHQGGVEKHNLAFSYYDQLHALLLDNPLDFSSLLMLISAFAETPRWKECMKFVEMSKLSGTPNVESYSPIVRAALRCGDDAFVDTLFVRMHSEAMIPSQDVFACMIEMGKVKQLLNYLQRFGWILTADVARLVRRHFESQKSSERWTVQLSSINRSGRCRKCDLQLNPPPAFADVVFEELRTAFMQQSLLRGGNLFVNTVPAELTEFDAMLERCKSFDFIIDGLNVAYKTHQKAPLRERDHVLGKVLQHFSGSRVLVLGRKHMQTWKSCQLDSHLGRSVEFFFTHNISSDDPFMLYAALYSGQQTSIVTSDELRDHRFLLGADLAGVLKTWQRAHQVRFIGLSKNKNTPIFKWPDVHDARVQQSKSGAWHIPFDDGYQRTSYELPNIWYCITRSGGKMTN